jgi:hypothetical protein
MGLDLVIGEARRICIPMRATIVILQFVKKRGMAAKRGTVLEHGGIEGHSFMIE